MKRILFLLSLVFLISTSVQATELRKIYITDPDTGAEVELDDSTSAQSPVTYEHHEIHSNSHYFVEDFTAAGSFDATVTVVASLSVTMP